MHLDADWVGSSISHASRLDLVVEFIYVERHSQQQEFRLYFYLTSQEETSKSHVLFQHPEGALNLNGAIRA